MSAAEPADFGFVGESEAVIRQLAAPLDARLRSQFYQQVAKTIVAQCAGGGLVHRIASEAQRQFERAPQPKSAPAWAHQGAAKPQPKPRSGHARRAPSYDEFY